jgi:putative phage-type endonuclease
MAHQAWLDKRRESNGGSDVGPIMGLSNYGSRLTVYLQKKGMAESGGSAAARRGTRLEPIIRQAVRDDYPGVEIAELPYMLYHPEFAYMSANLDGVVFIEKPTVVDGKELQGYGGYEGKTSKDGYGFSDDEIPDTYYAQAQHYMCVTGLPWLILAVYITSTDEVRVYTIMRDETFITNMLEQEKDFWLNYVEKNEMPAASGIDNEEEMITSMFSGTESIVLGEAEKTMCSEYVEYREAIKDMEAKQKTIKANLMAAIVKQAKGSPEEKKGTAIAGPYTIQWLTIESKRVDNDALKRDHIYEKYLKPSVYPRITITAQKEKTA